MFRIRELGVMAAKVWGWGCRSSSRIESVNKYWTASSLELFTFRPGRQESETFMSLLLTPQVQILPAVSSVTLVSEVLSDNKKSLRNFFRNWDSLTLIFHQFYICDSNVSSSSSSLSPSLSLRSYSFSDLINCSEYFICSKTAICGSKHLRRI